MQKRTQYALYCAIGAIAPLTQFLPWLLRNGFDPRMFLRLLFANPISSFFALDVLVASLVVIRMSVNAKQEVPRTWWFPILATLCVGVSLGLPLLLFLKEQQQEASVEGEI